MTKYRNIHGRKGGRGLRPWLLMPKILGVAVYFGGLVATMPLVFGPQPADLAAWQQRIDLIGAMFTQVLVPGLIVAILCGVGLLYQHAGVLIRMRWLQAKLVILALSLPGLHIFMKNHLQGMRAVAADEAGYEAEALATLSASMGLFQVGVIVAIALALAVIVLGRHKPRLGQGVRSVSGPRRGAAGGADAGGQHARYEPRT